MSSDNKQAACRIREEIWGKKNFGLAEQLFSADCAHHVHDPLTPPLENGPTGMKKLAQAYMNAFPDAHIQIDEVLGEGDRVMVRWSGQATHTGAFLQFTPTGRKVHVTGVDIYRFTNGKVQEHRILWDAMEFAGQLGLRP